MKSLRTIFFLGAIACIAAGPCLAALPGDVDPFIGTDNGGNLVPGPQVPFGFAHPSPDTARQDTSGYISSEPIIGFSQTHVSGTGGGSKYGNFRITPQVGPPAPEDLASPKAEEAAAPGYYSVQLTRPGVRAELTATRLVAVHRYTFPATTQAQLLLDLAAVANPGSPARQTPVECTARFVGPNRLEGTGNFIGGWNPSPYTLHFALEFSQPFTAHGVWRGKQLYADQTLVNAERTAAGVWATFDTAAGGPVIEVKVGLSFVSPAQARANLEHETAGANFDTIRGRAEALWQEALAKITVEGGTPEERRMFHTALYRVHSMPHDLTGENAWWDSPEPHYEDFYCLWDTFRCLHPLLTLIAPGRQRDMVRSLVDTYRHTGWMPDARIAGANGMIQGGSNADVLVADALVKGLDGIDYATAYAAMRKNAEVESSRPLYEGRELRDYLRLGYVSLDTPRSASRTVDYSYNDFCLALVAQRLGHAADAARYFARASNWTNLWDAETHSIRPRHANGRWMENYSPTANYSTMSARFAWWGAPYYEGTGYQYATSVPQDPYALVSRLGGDAPFAEWLDVFFGLKPGAASLDPKGLYTHDNEPDLLAAYLYLYAGRPERTQALVRRILAGEYHPGRGGLPGNDDGGAMSSWYVWNAAGLYPNAGQPLYYIVSPIFTRTTIDLGGGRVFVIAAAQASAENKFIQDATLNGQPLQRAWLTHAEITAGGTLTLRLGAQPSAWGQSERPPVFAPESQRGAGNIPLK